MDEWSLQMWLREFKLSCVKPYERENIQRTIWFFLKIENFQDCEKYTFLKNLKSS